MKNVTYFIFLIADLTEGEHLWRKRGCSSSLKSKAISFFTSIFVCHFHKLNNNVTNTFDPQLFVEVNKSSISILGNEAQKVENLTHLQLNKRKKIWK